MSTSSRGQRIYFAVPSAKHYQNQYYVNQPNRFVNLSVTGEICACKCDHCNGKLLGSMIDVQTPEQFRSVIASLSARNCEGILVSGGADRQGRVPLMPFLEEMYDAVQKGLRVIVHSGIIDRATAIGLKNAGVEQVLLDVIGDISTIQTVYHIDAGPEDYLQAMYCCKEAGLAVAPHLVIGLHYGEIKGEQHALEMIARADPDCLVLVILTPMTGTAMARIQNPGLTGVEALMEKAMELVAAPITLGCARPAGHYKIAVERKAVECGFPVIAFPDEQTVSYCVTHGITPVFMELCCSLIAGALPARSRW